MMLTEILNRLSSPSLLWEDLLDLCLYAKVTLPAPKRGGKKHRKVLVADIQTRIQAVREGMAWTLWESSPDNNRGVKRYRNRRPRTLKRRNAFRTQDFETVCGRYWTKGHLARR